MQIVRQICDTFRARCPLLESITHLCVSIQVSVATIQVPLSPLRAIVVRIIHCVSKTLTQYSFAARVFLWKGIILIVLYRRSTFKLCVAENGADVAISFLLKRIPQHTFYTSVIVLSNNYLHGLRNFLPPFFAMNKRKRLLTLTHGGRCFFTYPSCPRCTREFQIHLLQKTL